MREEAGEQAVLSSPGNECAQRWHQGRQARSMDDAVQLRTGLTV